MRSSRRESSTAGESFQETPFPEKLAAWILLATAAVAPWIGGSPTLFAGVRWWLAAALASAFVLMLSARLVRRRRPKLPLAALIPSVFLLGCLGWWSTQDELPFATAFGAEHWTFLATNTPNSLFQWPRLERLTFFTGLLLGFLAAIDLGRREKFRRQVGFALGLSALGVAVYAHGLAWLGWTNPAWVLINNGPESFNVCFDHYSGPPAALNLAWPLLIFGAGAGRSRWGIFTRVAALVVIGSAFPLWDSAAGKAIAIGLLLAGLGWKIGASRKWLTPRITALALVATFLILFVSQAWIVSRMQSASPDNWVSADNTLSHSAERDAEVRNRAGKRGDHLAMSTVPDRPSAWLAAARMAADYPLLGFGPGAWVKRSALYTHNSIVSTFFHYRQYAHHDLLQFAAEWGGLAAIAMMSLWVGGAWRALHRDEKEPRAEAGLVLALLGVALHSTVDFPLQNPAIQLWTALLLGLAWSGTRGKNSLSPRPAKVSNQ